MFDWARILKYLYRALALAIVSLGVFGMTHADDRTTFFWSVAFTAYALAAWIRTEYDFRVSSGRKR